MKIFRENTGVVKYKGFDGEMKTGIIVSNPVVTSLMSRRSMRERVILALCDRREKAEFLENKPYRLLPADLAAYAVIKPDKDGNTSYLPVTKVMLPAIAKDAHELFELASSNMRPYMSELTDMVNTFETLRHPCNELEYSDDEVPFDENATHVLTAIDGDTTCAYGAGVLFISGMLKRLRALVGDYYVIPSSIHEVLIIPDKGQHNESEMLEWVHEANSTPGVVSASEILSNDIFHFDGVEFVRIGGAA